MNALVGVAVGLLVCAVVSTGLADDNRFARGVSVGLSTAAMAASIAAAVAVWTGA